MDQDRDRTEADVTIADEDPASAAALWCLGQYYAELASRFEEGFDPQVKAYAGVKAEGAPEPCFIIARLAGEPVACGALIPDAQGIAEIKRMWVKPEARGHGIARRLLAELEARARALGCAYLRLDTNRSLPEAQKLYRTAGYAAIERYSENPYAHHWFGKNLEESRNAESGE